MSNYNETIENLEKIEKMINESQSAIENAKELLEQIGKEMQEKLQINLKLFPDKLKEEIDKIKNNGEIPQTITTTQGENYIYIEPSSTLNNEEQNKIMKLERNRALKMLETIYKKVINYSSDTIKPTSLPSLSINYDESMVKIGLNTPDVIEMANQITTLNDYILRFENDIEKLQTGIDNLQFETNEQSKKIVEQAQSTLQCTAEEERLIKQILHGKGITPAIGMSQGKEIEKDTYER